MLRICVVACLAATAFAGTKVASKIDGLTRRLTISAREQLRQLSDVGGDAPGLVAGERCAHVYAPARLLRVGFE
jgi:hypothetical protein